MTFSIKDTVKNIREQHNLGAIPRLRQTVSAIFEALETALYDDAWTRHVGNDRDYCQTRYERIADGEGNVVLEDVVIRLHDDKIQIYAAIPPQFSASIAPINTADLVEIIKTGAQQYDFPITFTIYSENCDNRDICNFEYIPD